MDFDEIIKDQMKNVVDQDNLDSLSDYASNLSGGISEHFTIDKILEATLNGKSIFDSQEIITSLKELFLYEMKSALIVGVEILTICIVIGLLKNLSGSFSKKRCQRHRQLDLQHRHHRTCHGQLQHHIPTYDRLYENNRVYDGYSAAHLNRNSDFYGSSGLRHNYEPAAADSYNNFSDHHQEYRFTRSLHLNSVVADQLFNRKRLRKPTIQIYKTAGVVRHRHHHDPHVWNYSDSRAYRQDVGQSFDRYGEVLYRRVYPNRRRIHS